LGGLGVENGLKISAYQRFLFAGISEKQKPRIVHLLFV